MASLEWRDQYRTGIAGVDNEHQALIAQINAVLELIGRQAEQQRVIDGLGDIYGAIAAHFALEERMMERHDYAEYAEHKADHDRLLDEIQELTFEFESSEALDRGAFMQGLADWFGNHFQTHDARLHRLAWMREHDHASPSKIKKMIQHAKDRLRHRS